MWWVQCAFGQTVTGAMPDLDAQHFRPTIDGDGLLWVDDAGRREERILHTRALLGYTGDPLVWRDGGEVVHVLRDVWALDLLGGVQQGRVRIGLRIPVVLLAQGEVRPDDGGLGDLQLDGKLTVLDGDHAPFDLATSFRLTLPTNTLDVALGSSRPGMEVVAIGSRRVGPLLLAGNVGVSGIASSAAVARAAVGYAADPGGVAAELAGTVPLDSDAASTWEVLLTGHARVNSGLSLRGGVGTGLTHGIGSPDARVVVGIAYDSPMEAGWDGPQ